MVLVVDELEVTLDRGAFVAIVVHLLGLDDCKDRGLPTDGAMLVFQRLTRAARETDRNIVVTTDHPWAAAALFALLTRPGWGRRLRSQCSGAPQGGIAPW